MPLWRIPQSQPFPSQKWTMGKQKGFFAGTGRERRQGRLSQYMKGREVPVGICWIQRRLLASLLKNNIGGQWQIALMEEICDVLDKRWI